VATPVSVAGYAFSPMSITIKAGTSVKWTNDDAVDHTTTSDGGSWNSGQMSAPSGGGGYGGMTAGGSFTYTFSSAGTFAYHCANHTYMTGTITVTP
jgi:plastocyanin